MWKRLLIISLLVSALCLPLYSADVSEMTSEELWTELMILLPQQEVGWDTLSKELMTVSSQLKPLTEITELSHAISEDEQRLTEGVERLVELQLDARTGSERHKRIEDIIKELQKRNSNN